MITFFCIVNATFAIEKQGDLLSNLTTTELQDYIKKLQADKNDINANLKSLSKEYGDLIGFLKTDLSSLEIKSMKETLEFFSEKKAFLEQDIKDKISAGTPLKNEKIDLLKFKWEVYKFLYTFVPKEKNAAYINYVKVQLQSQKNSKEIIDEIEKSKSILDDKITYYTKKIEQDKKELKEKIDSSITEKIKQRIEDIDSNPKYKWIPQDTKNTIYTDFIKTLQNSLKENEQSNFSEGYKEIRKNILQKMMQEIQAKIK